MPKKNDATAVLMFDAEKGQMLVAHTFSRPNSRRHVVVSDARTVSGSRASLTRPIQRCGGSTLKQAFNDGPRSIGIEHSYLSTKAFIVKPSTL